VRRKEWREKAPAPVFDEGITPHASLLTSHLVKSAIPLTISSAIRNSRIQTIFTEIKGMKGIDQNKRPVIYDFIPCIPFIPVSTVFWLAGFARLLFERSA
jgi:hypothetical protein